MLDLTNSMLGSAAMGVTVEGMTEFGPVQYATVNMDNRRTRVVWIRLGGLLVTLSWRAE